MRKGWKGAWKALTSQYAGQDKWETEIKCEEQLLHTRVWKGQSNFSLENFILQHSNAFVSMQASTEHVQYQLPIEHSRVRLLLEAIQCSDPILKQQQHTYCPMILWQEEIKRIQERLNPFIITNGGL